MTLDVSHFGGNEGTHEDWIEDERETGGLRARRYGRQTDQVHGESDPESASDEIQD
jgi:hypothetical protein